MSTTAANDFQQELNQQNTTIFAHLMRAYTECSDNVQAMIIEMVDILHDAEADEDDKRMALATIQEALFPSNCDGALGVDIDVLDDKQAADDGDGKALVAELDDEEAIFAQRVRDRMEEIGLTQAELARAIGVQQPAISMMISRKCRPQNSTVMKIADALDVAPEDLWPPLKTK